LIVEKEAIAFRLAGAIPPAASLEKKLADGDLIKLQALTATI
jgi:hypothetical protein